PPRLSIFCASISRKRINSGGHFLVLLAAKKERAHALHVPLFFKPDATLLLRAIPLAVAGDRLVAQGNDQSGFCLTLELLNQSLKFRAGIDFSTGCRDLIEMFRYHAPRLYYLIYRESGFVRS